MAQAESKNMKLIAQDTLVGFGGMGEGMSMQLVGDGRRILWLAHESAPKNFTGVDVTNPSKPEVVVQTELPHMDMRSNSLEVTGDIMAVAYQTKGRDMQPAGVELFDLSSPEDPKSISFFDCSGPHSRGVHQLWFADGEYVHFAGGAEDFVPTNPDPIHPVFRSIFFFKFPERSNSLILAIGPSLYNKTMLSATIVIALPPAELPPWMVSSDSGIISTQFSVAGFVLFILIILPLGAFLLV